MLTETDCRKREHSPLPLTLETTYTSTTPPPTKRTKTDSTNVSNEAITEGTADLFDGEFQPFWANQSPAVTERQRPQTPTRDGNRWSLPQEQWDLANDTEEEMEGEEEEGSAINERYALGDKPFRRSLYNELLSSSLAPEDDELQLDSRRKSAIITSSLFEDEMDSEENENEAEYEDTEEDKTTLPLSRPYISKSLTYDDEVDAFFSSYNPPVDEPGYVLSATQKMSILQQQHKSPPPYITEWPHFIEKDYFKTHHLQDRYIIPDEEKENIQIHTTPYFDSHFSMLKNMGSGEFAEVWKTQQLDTGVISAIKKSKLPFTGWDDRWQQLVEVEHLECVKNSKYCVDIMNAWEERGYLYIQLELCSSGSLDNYIKFKNGKIPEDIVWSIFYELVLGIKDIHQEDIVHLDLKPTNILIDNKGTVKIGDFGISVHVPVNMHLVKGEGDRKYMAPDLLREEFDKPADIFSLGLILLELATGIVLPGTGESWEMLRTGDFTKQKTALSKLSTEMSCMIEWLLITESKNRPSVKNIMEHPTFQKVEEASKLEQSSSLLSYVYEMERLAIEDAEKLEQRNLFNTPEGRVFPLGI